MKPGKLDDKFALGEASKPFSNAIKQTFTTGNVLPLVSGAFAEVNAEAKRLVEKCARHAAALEENSDITPEEACYAKGSAYNLLLSQFRRAIGCLGMKAAVEEKLRRIMLIRSNKREANAAAHMEQATIVNVSTKTHLDSIQMNAMKLIMIPSIDTVQNMIISTLTRIEIMQICKWV
jgi:hypothetical protein